VVRKVFLQGCKRVTEKVSVIVMVKSALEKPTIKFTECGPARL